MRVQNRSLISGWRIFLFAAFCMPVFTFAQDGNLGLGKKYFEGKCARCHGKDARGSDKMAHHLGIPLQRIDLGRGEVLKMSIYQIEAMIDSGKHRMPKYRGKLTDAQIHDIAMYVKKLTETGNPGDEKPVK